MTHPLRGLRHLRAAALRQGRYKSLIVEEDSCLGALQHYVHLNPVRAKMCSVEDLKDYRWSSFWYLHQMRKRPDFLDISGALEHAGGLRDTPAGRRKYMEYLKWLSTNEPARKELAFDKMCRGWALGTKQFKKDLLQTEGLLKDGSTQALRLEGKELQEANELQWEEMFTKGLDALGMSTEDIHTSMKSADWKVWLAYELKRRTSATNVWIADRLNMGVPQAVTIHTGRLNVDDLLKNSRYEQFIYEFTK